MGIGELEAAATGGLTVNIGSAFGAKSADPSGFAGLYVDLFAKSELLSELERPQTWASWLASLRPGGCAELERFPSNVLPPSRRGVRHHIHVHAEGPKHVVEKISIQA
jgi:hypothetical protein